VADRLPGPPALRSVGTLALTLVLLIVLLGGTGWALYRPLHRAIQQLPDILQRADDGLQALADRVGYAGRLTTRELGEMAGQLLTGESVARLLPDVAGTIVTVVLAVAVVVIGAMYLLSLRPGFLSGKAISLLPPDRQDPARQAVAGLQPQLRWWLIGTLIRMVAVGLAFGAGYGIIGLEFALPLATFGGLAESVAVFGPMITLLLSLLIAATQGWGMVVGVTVVYIVVQTLETYAITPLVMRRAVHVPPIVTLFTIIFWGNVFGAAGLILAIPLDLTIWALLKPFVIEKQAAEAGHQA